MIVVAGDRSLHVVQVGYDDSVLDRDAGSDTLTRQRQYAAELTRQRANAHLTYCVITTRRTAATQSDGPLTILPCRGSSLRIAQVGLWRALTALHRVRPISVIATQTLFADGAIAALFGYRHSIPVVGQLHHFLDLDRESNVRRRLARFTLARSAAVRTVNAAAADDLRAKKLAKRPASIPVPVSMTPGAGATPAREPVVLFVGSFTDIKRPDIWLRVAQKIAAARPAVRFVAAGDGPLLERTKAAASGSLSGRVTFLGRVPYEQLSHVYATASVLLMTSRSEGFGRVAVEAYRHETPVVGTNVGGLGDIVEEGVSGFLRSPDDVDGLAEATLALLDDPSRRAAYGARGKRHVDAHFDSARLTESWVRMLISSGERDLELRLPAPPTLQRWGRLRGRAYSLLRGLEYERLETLSLPGQLLDVGGGARADYRSLLRGYEVVHSVNIDPGMRPTMVTDLNVGIPAGDNVYDTIVSLNTLEHIRCDTVAIGEMIRVLKPGGSMHVLVPFLYRVHAIPHDYHRHTWHWWQAHLAAGGIDADSIRIEPLVWDRLSSAYSLVEHAPGMGWLKPAVMLVGIARARFGGWRSRSDYALGYYITGMKRRS